MVEGSSDYERRKQEVLAHQEELRRQREASSEAGVGVSAEASGGESVSVEPAKTGFSPEFLLERAQELKEIKSGVLGDMQPIINDLNRALTDFQGLPEAIKLEESSEFAATILEEVGFFDGLYRRMESAENLNEIESIMDAGQDRVSPAQDLIDRVRELKNKIEKAAPAPTPEAGAEEEKLQRVNAVVAAGKEVYEKSRESGLSAEEISGQVFEKLNRLPSAEEKMEAAVVLIPWVEAQRSEEASAGLPPTEDERRILEDTEGRTEGERAKIGWGARNLVFKFKEVNSRRFSKMLEGAAENRQGFTKRFLQSTSESFRQDAETAWHKIEDIDRGGLSTRRVLEQAGYAARGVSKIVRPLVGISAFYSPFAAPIFLSAATARGAEILKETRLKNEEVINKTRFGGTAAEGSEEMARAVEAAMTEAIKIYEKAGGNYDPEGTGGGVSVEKLTKAYRENLPQDLLQRIEKNPEVSWYNLPQKFFRWHIKKSAENVEKKLAKIEDNAKLSADEKTARTEKLFSNYARRLHDFDRILGQEGTADGLAMFAKDVNYLAQAGVAAATAVSVTRFVNWLSHNSLTHMGDHLARAVGFERHDVPQAIADFEKMEGIDTSDGMDARGAKVILGYMNEMARQHHMDVVKGLALQYYKYPVQGDGRTFGQIMEDNFGKDAMAQFMAGSGGASGAIHPEQKNMPPAAVENKPVVPKNHFEDEINDSTANNGNDSIWKSTKNIFVSRTPEELHRMGFETPRSDPQFGAKLDAWAERQTANVVNLYAREHGGKITDLVHDGDRVSIDLDAQGHAHLTFTESSGIKAGFLHHAEKATNTGEKSNIVSAENSKPEVLTDSKIQTVGELYAKAPVAERAGVIHDYIAQAEKTGDITTKGYSPEEINLFSKQFPVKGIAETIADINTPQKLSEALGKFDAEIRTTTQSLISEFTARSGNGVERVPVISKTGKILFAEIPHEAREIKNPKIKIFDYDAQGRPAYLKHGWWLRKTENFKPKDLRKFLGY